jgi:phytoene dehydrogenase-like protein
MRYDALIIGGGHNGLTCACYLAGAGLKVRVLERRDIVGGAAVTEEFHPGFRNSTASYTVSLLNPKVIQDLRLKEHGLKVILRPLANFLPLSDKDYLKVGGGLQATQKEFARFSKQDAERLPAYYESLERVADVLRDLILQTPPNAGGGVGELMKVLRQSRRFVRLPIEVQRDVLALFTKSAGQVLEQWFESDPAQAVFGFDSIVGNFASPYTPESAYVLLHHVFGEVNGEKGAWGHAIGGMGAITQAMQKEALVRGVEITTGAEVSEVRVKAGRAVGAVLKDGTEIDADIVVSNLNPKLLYLKLVDQQHLDPDFLTRIQGWRCGSGTLRMNVALSELPDFTCLPGKQAQVHHSSGIIMAPSLKYMERAYFDAKRDGFAKEPIVEMLIPSTVDDSLAPKGQHVASLFCQHFDPEPQNGKTWDEMREAAADTVIDTVDRFAPNFKKSVLGRMVLTPLDLERRFGLIGGDIFHGALTLDQLFSARPVLGNAAYRAPIGALYMCGAGSHPGGGVTGAPGHNAAREILSDLRWRKLLPWRGHARRG